MHGKHHRIEHFQLTQIFFSQRSKRYFDFLLLPTLRSLITTNSNKGMSFIEKCNLLSVQYPNVIIFVTSQGTVPWCVGAHFDSKKKYKWKNALCWLPPLETPSLYPSISQALLLFESTKNDHHQVQLCSQTKNYFCQCKSTQTEWSQTNFRRRIYYRGQFNRSYVQTVELYFFLFEYWRIFF